MSFGCSSKELKKFLNAKKIEIEHLILKGLRLKSSRNYPQILLQQ